MADRTTAKRLANNCLAKPATEPSQVGVAAPCGAGKYRNRPWGRGCRRVRGDVAPPAHVAGPARHPDPLARNRARRLLHGGRSLLRLRGLPYTRPQHRRLSLDRNQCLCRRRESDPVTIFPQERAQRSPDLKIPAHAIRGRCDEANRWAAVDDWMTWVNSRWLAAGLSARPNRQRGKSHLHLPTPFRCSAKIPADYRGMQARLRGTSTPLPPIICLIVPSGQVPSSTNILSPKFNVPAGGSPETTAGCAWER
jgi:hypothetical protein